MRVINCLKDGREFTAESWKRGLENGTIIVPEETRQTMLNIMVGATKSEEVNENEG